MNTMNFNDAVCERIRSQLDAYLSNELSVETSHDAMRHLETCPGCSQELETRTRVRNLLRRALQSETAPSGLRGRIERRIRRSESPFVPLRLLPGWALTAAAAALVAVVGLLIMRWRTERLYDNAAAQEAYVRAIDARLPGIASVGLSDHLHCAVFRRFPQQYPKDPVAVQQLGPEFVRLVPLIRERVPAKYRIVMAHRCVVGGRHYVHVVLKSESNLLSVVITEKRPGESFIEMDPAHGLNTQGAIRAVPVYQAGAKRYEVAGFESHGYLAFVVSDLDHRRNLEIAEGLAPVVTGFLNSVNG
jgi:anti-sigma factor (TIGR02949 family)